MAHVKLDQLLKQIIKNETAGMDGNKTHQFIPYISIFFCP